MSGDFVQKNGKVRGNGNGWNGHYGWKFIDKWGVFIVVITMFSAFVFVDKWIQQKEDKVVQRAREEAKKDTEHLKAIMELRMDRLERKIDRMVNYLYEREEHTYKFRE